MFVKKGFTLIEVLVSGFILVTVGAAVVSLSNTISQGSVVQADTSVANRLAGEGIEKVTKVRDDSMSSGTSIWLAQAETSSKYGWYYLDSTDSLKQLNDISSPKSSTTAVVTSSSYNSDESYAKITLNNIPYYRLICIEAVGATETSDDNNVYCNTNDGTNVLSDGTRAVGPTCETGDVYCNFSQSTLGAADPWSSSKIIPSGNAVKVRSVVVWQDKDVNRAADMSTLLTNWKSH